MSEDGAPIGREPVPTEPPPPAPAEAAPPAPAEAAPHPIEGEDTGPATDATAPSATPPASEARDGSADEPVIVARGIRRVFGEEVAVDGVDLSIPRGSIYGFVGPSGSGKTTTVRLLTGIDAPTEGEVTVLGRTSDHFDRPLRSRIGYMPQQSVQFPNLSVQENMSFVASIYGLPLRNRDVIEEVLRQTELYEHRKKLVHDLSGGMQRRLALSAALVHHPDLLFLDEPTAGIDPVLRRTLWNHFEALRDEGCTLFITTQYVSEAAYCDRVGVLSGGRLVAEDTPQGLRRLALGGDLLELTPSQPLDETTLVRLREVEGVRDVERMRGGTKLRFVVDAAEVRLPEIQSWCAEHGITVESLREDQPPFDDIFANLMRQDAEPDEFATAEAR
jgi:ABC-2 type transport system ATP-binding protein